MTVMPAASSGCKWRLHTIKELSTALQEKMEDASMVFSSGECLPSYREKLRTNQNIQASWSYGIISHDKFDPPIVSIDYFDLLIVCVCM